MDILIFWWWNLVGNYCICGMCDAIYILIFWDFIDSFLTKSALEDFKLKYYQVSNCFLFNIWPNIFDRTSYFLKASYSTISFCFSFVYREGMERFRHLSVWPRILKLFEHLRVNTGSKHFWGWNSSFRFFPSFLYPSLVPYSLVSWK